MARAPTLTAIAARRWMTALVLAAMLLSGWAAIGHRTGSCCQEITEAKSAACAAGGCRHQAHDDRRHESPAPAREHDPAPDHESGSCALCVVEARLPNLAPPLIVLPAAGETIAVVLPDAPDAPSIRRARPRLPRGPPSALST